MKHKTGFLKTAFLILLFSFAHCSDTRGNANAIRSLLLLFMGGDDKKVETKVITGEENGGTTSPEEFKALLAKAKSNGLPVPSTIGSPQVDGQVTSMTQEELAAELRQGETANQVNYDKLINNQNLPEEIRQRIAADQKRSAADFAANSQRIQDQLKAVGHDQPSLKDAVTKVVKDGKVVVAGVEIPVGK